MNYLYQSIQSFVSVAVSNTIDYISNHKFDTWLIFAVYGCSKIQINLGTTIKTQTDRIKTHLIKYKTVQKCARVLTKIYEYAIKTGRLLYSLLYKHRVEPLEPEWIDISEITSLATEQIPAVYKYSEEYTFIQDQLSDTDKSNLFNTQYLEATTKRFIQDSNCSDKLMIAKLDNKYLYRVISNHKPTASSQSTQSTASSRLYSIIPSKTRFLSISYSHPKQENAIYIDIPVNHCFSGNEILSACFILRCLEYQSMPYVFDLDYSIYIIDNQVNQMQIKSNQYVLLLENKYTICTV